MRVGEKRKNHEGKTRGISKKMTKSGDTGKRECELTESLMGHWSHTYSEGALIKIFFLKLEKREKRSLVTLVRFHPLSLLPPGMCHFASHAHLPSHLSMLPFCCHQLVLVMSCSQFVKQMQQTEGTMRRWL